MLNEEFSNQFDVLFNSITSNQAPGLDDYEKSVFLTKAQSEILLSYFDPRSNKVQEGFDGSERRQIDFSSVIKSFKYKESVIITVNPVVSTDTYLQWSDFPFKVSKSITDNFTISSGNMADEKELVISPSNDAIISSLPPGMNVRMGLYTLVYKDLDTNSEGIVQESAYTLRAYPKKNTEGFKSFKDPMFDLRPNTRAIPIESDILTIINESVEVIRGDNTTLLNVVPINYLDYSRLMSKPYKRPHKNQAWRLIENSDSTRVAEIVIGPIDTLYQYVIRYVKRPRPIIVGPLDGLTIEGEEYDETKKCELDPILHPDILQRAVELAIASISGDLNSQIALGNSSQTSIGVIQTKQ